MPRSVGSLRQIDTKERKERKLLQFWSPMGSGMTKKKLLMETLNDP